VKQSLIRTLPIFLFNLVLVICAGCSADVTALETATPTPQVIITSTLPPTQTPLPSPTPEPATATIPVTPAEGQTTSQLNIRSAPSANSQQLGTVNIFAKVQIVGKDPTGGWWMIVYPESPTGTGWITAEFVQVPDSSSIPVIAAQTSEAGSVSTTEANPTSGAGSVEGSTPVPTQILATAYPDGDSAQSPAVSITLSSASVKSFNYSSDISSPEGDAEDWVQFILDGQTGQQTIVTVMLDCSGSGALNLDLIQNNVSLQGWTDISCGQRSQLQLFLFAGAPYSLRLFPAQENGSLKYIAYTVIVQLSK